MSLTLADVLYASFKAPVPEGDWARLVRCVAASDQSALHALYERSHRIVFTLIMRITANRETAEEITLDVFHDIWRRARDYFRQMPGRGIRSWTCAPPHAADLYGGTAGARVRSALGAPAVCADEFADRFERFAGRLEES